MGVQEKIESDLSAHSTVVDVVVTIGKLKQRRGRDNRRLRGALRQGATGSVVSRHETLDERWRWRGYKANAGFEAASGG